MREKRESKSHRDARKGGRATTRSGGNLIRKEDDPPPGWFGMVQAIPQGLMKSLRADFYPMEPTEIRHWPSY
jgi:hypothetical protein